MHFRLDDINRAGAAVSRCIRLDQIVHSRRDRHHGVERAFGYLLTAHQHGVSRHQVADIAHEKDGSARQDTRRPVWRGQHTVALEAASDCALSLAETLDEIAFHQAEPVSIC